MPLVVGFTVVVSVSQTYSPLMPAFTKEVLGTGNEGFGLVAGAAAFGGLLASIAIAASLRVTFPSATSCLSGRECHLYNRRRRGRTQRNGRRHARIVPSRRIARDKVGAPRYFMDDKAGRFRTVR